MATEQKGARILSKVEQKKSIKGVQKPKKNIIKNYLESPFALEWPNITTEHEEEITTLLRKNCLGLKKLECRPPWKQVSKYRGVERKKFLMEYSQKFQENLDPDDIKQNKKRDEALSNLIFGYNAVMRALEKDRIAGILVKKNVEPSFITKTFLPGCANKAVPLVPLYDLDKLLKDRETLALPHACLVLGLKLSVKQESSLFHTLYTKMCEALSIVEEDSDEDGDEEEENYSLEGPAGEDDKRIRGPEVSHQLTEEEIHSYHLKRIGKNRRAFVPGAKDEKMEIGVIASDFISFGASETHSSPLTHMKEIKPQKTAKSKLDSIEVTSDSKTDVDFSKMFCIDASGDEGLLKEQDHPQSNTSDTKKPTKKTDKRKRKEKKMGGNSYVPAKTKRLKGNPNRKSKVK